jgi:hypothetical protein
VPDTILHACGFRHPQHDAGWLFSWERLLKSAECITDRTYTEVTYRELDSISFVERPQSN